MQCPAGGRSRKKKSKETKLGAEVRKEVGEPAPASFVLTPGQLSPPLKGLSVRGGDVSGGSQQTCKLLGGKPSKDHLLYPGPSAFKQDHFQDSEGQETRP